VHNKQAQGYSIYAPIGVGFDHVLRLILKKSVVSTGLCDFHTHAYIKMQTCIRKTFTVRDVLTSCFRAESPRSATGIALSGFCSTKFLLLFFGLCFRSAQVGGKAPRHSGRSSFI
jgi:hypothetical protein